tara:strand:- start:40 stop:471 length:432 start_codon:yes stop_codon:yes gene_type:complete
MTGTLVAAKAAPYVFVITGTINAPGMVGDAKVQSGERGHNLVERGWWIVARGAIKHGREGVFVVASLDRMCESSRPVVWIESRLAVQAEYASTEGFNYNGRSGIELLECLLKNILDFDVQGQDKMVTWNCRPWVVGVEELKDI